MLIATLMPKQLAPLVSSAEGIAQLLMNMCAPYMPALPLPQSKHYQPAVGECAQQSRNGEFGRDLCKFRLPTPEKLK